MFPAFLKLPFLDMASSVWAMPEEQWIDDAATKEDIEMLEKECQGDSIIDKINFRKLTLDMWKRKEIELFVRELPGRTRVVFLGTLVILLVVFYFMDIHLRGHLILLENNLVLRM